jgi:hypothetical protein
MPAAVLRNTQPAVDAPSNRRTFTTVWPFDSLVGFLSWWVWHLIAGARLELLGLCAVKLNWPWRPRRQFIFEIFKVIEWGHNLGTS